MRHPIRNQLQPHRRLPRSNPDMLRASPLTLILCLLPPLGAADVDGLLRAAVAAEARLDPRGALALLRQAEAEDPRDVRILQLTAKQYSDLAVQEADPAGAQRCVRAALDYSRRAVALAPDDPVNLLSLAICHGKLAVFGDTRTKVEYSRLVRQEAERALALKPDYAWACHVLGRWHYEVAGLGRTAKFLVRLFYGGLPAASVDEGVRLLQRATELEPDELNHWLELGFACAAAGRTDEARVHWRHGLAMPARGLHDEPAKARAREALARSE